MKVTQVLNNNVIIANNDIEDLIILGRGIGFNAKKSDVVNEQYIEKVFRAPTENEEIQKIVNIISNINPKYFNLSHDIIDEISMKTNRTFSDSLIIFLAEQLEYKVIQSKNNIARTTSTWGSIRREYPIEFEVLFQSIKILNVDNNVRLTSDDVAFLTMFIAHRYTDTDKDMFYKYETLCKEIKDVVEKYYYIDEKSHTYNKFVTHINMQAKRVLVKKQLSDGNLNFYQTLKKEYPFEYSVICEINNNIKNKIGFEFNDIEMMYDLIHLISLNSRKDK